MNPAHLASVEDRRCKNCQSCSVGPTKINTMCEWNWDTGAQLVEARVRLFDSRCGHWNLSWN